MAWQKQQNYQIWTLFFDNVRYSIFKQIIRKKRQSLYLRTEKDFQWHFAEGIFIILYVNKFLDKRQTKNVSFTELLCLIPYVPQLKKDPSNKSLFLLESLFDIERIKEHQSIYGILIGQNRRQTYFFLWLEGVHTVFQISDCCLNSWGKEKKVKNKAKFTSIFDNSSVSSK